MSEAKRQTLRLNEARETTPAVCPIEAMRRQLALAVFDGVKPQDVLDMACQLKEMAQKGDLKAMKMYFELVLGKGVTSAPPPPPPPPPQPTAAVEAIVEAIEDLVDEIRIGKAKKLKVQSDPLLAARKEDD